MCLQLLNGAVKGAKPPASSVAKGARPPASCVYFATSERSCIVTPRGTPCLHLVFIITAVIMACMVSKDRYTNNLH